MVYSTTYYQDKKEISEKASLSESSKFIMQVGGLLCFSMF